MNFEDLRKNFNEQLKSAELQIKSLETDLDKAKEYKLKLLGGLETLELLESTNTSESINDEVQE